MLPCPQRSLCIDPANPIANFSAESYDPNLYLGYDTYWNPPPPLGAGFTSTGCLGECVSTVSQDDADLCAHRQTILCDVNPDDPGGGYKNPGDGGKLPVFANSVQSATRFCPDGIPFVYTVPAGSFFAFSKVQADQQALSYAQSQVNKRYVCLSSLNPTQTKIESTYIGRITAAGPSVSAFGNSWSIFGSLPPGVSFDPSNTGTTLVLSGVPTSGGVFIFTVRFADALGDFMDKQFSLCVVFIIQDTLPAATVGQDYNQTLKAPNCSTLPLSWQVVSGALPGGLSLDEETGLISGIPTTQGTYNFTIELQTEAT